MRMMREKTENHSVRILFRISFLIMVGFFLLISPAAAQDKGKARPKITPEELAMTDCPEQPGAPAVCLYYERIDDKKKGLVSVFKRIKILTPAGRDYADLEIYYNPMLEKVKNIEIKVIDPDGNSGQVKPDELEKVAAKVGDLEYRVKTLAIPDISPGKIIDYYYEVVSEPPSLSIGFNEIYIEIALSLSGDENSQPVVHWDLQDRIFIRRARFIFMAGSSAMAKHGKFVLGWASLHLKDVKPKITEGRLELEVENIPPFEEEEFMPPKSHQKISFDIFYINPEIKSNEQYWQKAPEDWLKYSEKYMASKKDLVKVVNEITENETDSKGKIIKIYERVQLIRNLSYEKGMTEKEQKKFKDNKNCSDVLKNNYGYRNEIVRTFVALARAAGFEAYLVRVVSRDDKLFRQTIPLFYTQFDSEIAMVKVENKYQPFDPATPFCPFGLLFWPKSNTAALTFERGKPVIFTSPGLRPEQALSQRETTLTPDADGNLAGKIQITYHGQEALIRRLKLQHADAIKIKEELEEELRKNLPSGARVSMNNVTGLNESSPQVVVDYEVILTGVANQVGDRLILPVYPLINPDCYPFRLATRKHHIYFDYPYQESDNLTINLPENLGFEALPPIKEKNTDSTRFSLKYDQEQPGKIRIQRELCIKKNLFAVSQYASLRDFFDFVRAGDEEQIILKKVNID